MTYATAQGPCTLVVCHGISLQIHPFYRLPVCTCCAFCPPSLSSHVIVSPDHHMLTYTTHRSGFGWTLGSSGGLQPAPRNVKRPPANQCHPKLGYTTRDFHGQFCRSSRYVLPGTFPVFCLLLSVCLIALSYNAINSAIDGVRGRHDAYGSMAAGALTGALYKSTGTSQIGRDTGLN